MAIHKVSQVNDIGGEEALLDIPIPADKKLQLWELQCYALVKIYSVDKALLTFPEFRLAQEGLPEHFYKSWSYFETWSAAMANLFLEKGILSPGELEAELFADVIQEETAEPLSPKFALGDEVQVRSDENCRTVWRRPHLRTPGYIFGAPGVIERVMEPASDESFAAYCCVAKKQYVYRVRFHQRDLWPEVQPYVDDAVDVEVFESWLLKRDTGSGEEEETPQLFAWGQVASQPTEPVREPSDGPSGHEHSHEHGPDHEPHLHLSRCQIELNAANDEGPPRPGQAVLAALIRLLVAKGDVTRDQIRKWVEKIELWGKDCAGFRLVARAWVDPEFSRRLLVDGNVAAAEMGIECGATLIVVANEVSVHNLLVCTLCSCYPVAILGPSPSWYRSRSYRAKAVRKPRELLQEFGLELPPQVKVIVHDNTANVRYIVLPVRPAGTEEWTEEELRKLVTRDSLVGVALPVTSKDQGDVL